MNESYLLLVLRLKKTRLLIESGKYNCAIRMFDTMMNVQDDYIKMRMFFGCVYVMQQMYSDALQTIRNAQAHLSKRVMGKELLKKRMIAKFDIGVLDMLPDLCIHKIVAKV